MIRLVPLIHNPAASNWMFGLSYTFLGSPKVFGAVMVPVVFCQIHRRESIFIPLGEVHSMRHQKLTALVATAGVKGQSAYHWQHQHRWTLMGEAARTSTSPFSAALCSGVPPKPSFKTVASIRNSRSRMRWCPPLAAKCSAVAPSLSWLEMLTSVKEVWRRRVTLNWNTDKPLIIPSIPTHLIDALIDESHYLLTFTFHFYSTWCSTDSLWSSWILAQGCNREIIQLIFKPATQSLAQRPDLLSYTSPPNSQVNHISLRTPKRGCTVL